MTNTNICRFIPVREDYNSIHTINFVLETERKEFSGLIINSVYKMYLVTEGEGVLHTTGEKYRIQKGDLFFTFPGSAFCIESTSEDFRYIYISFLGTRGNLLMDRLRIGGNNFIFHGFEDLIPFWKQCINMSAEVSDTVSESVLLYSFSVLGELLIQPVKKDTNTANAFIVIKKYIDDNYVNPKLSLDLLSKELKYNKKYISSAFKKGMGVGISEYINTIRIQHACTLISQGFESVSDISYQSGFLDAQYFSKVFKKIRKISPKQHIADVKSGRYV